MNDFFERWGDAALTTLGFFWMALWAFVLGYVVSSCIQVFVTKERMQQAMGKAGTKSVLLAAFFGLISSSCSFAALATTKSLFKKGAGLVPALAFLLASTNLVIELGIIIAIFLSWQFVVGEYVGGLLLIACMWVLVRLTLPRTLERRARERVEDEQSPPAAQDWKRLLFSREGWQRVARQYFMEWGMVWRDVVFGFTVAGIISAMVPDNFFTTLFVGSGGEDPLAFWQVALQTLIGPVAAFFTFIGSMGNIPLAALLYGHGVSFAGVMAFIFSDLVVLPVLRINARYYGWPMALYILGILLVSLVATALILHYSLAGLGLLPETPSIVDVEPSDRFAIDHTFFLNLGFIAVSFGLAWLARSGAESSGHSHDHDSSRSLADRILDVLVWGSGVWLLGGLLCWWFVSSRGG